MTEGDSKLLASLRKNLDEFDCRGHDYAFILGLNPSLGARSPSLWNTVYRRLGVPQRMICLDCEPDDLDEMLNILSADPACLGGCVTNPYKSIILKHSSVTPNVNVIRIGAANCLHRIDLAAPDFIADNTDASAALECFASNGIQLAGKKILIYGYGGVAKAVIGGLLSLESLLAVESPEIFVAIRSGREVNKDERLSSGVKFLDVTQAKRRIHDFNIIVNCTNVGHRNQGAILSVDDLRDARNCSWVFDVVYEPAPTQLVKNARLLGLNSTDGLDMNLHQAALAFMSVNQMLVDDLSLDSVIKIMKGQN